MVPGFDDISIVYRVDSCDGTFIGESDSIDGAIEVVKAQALGRYVVQVISLDPATDNPQARDWGAIIKSGRGTITLDVPPWIDWPRQLGSPGSLPATTSRTLATLAYGPPVRP